MADAMLGALLNQAQGQQSQSKSQALCEQLLARRAEDADGVDSFVQRALGRTLALVRFCFVPHDRAFRGCCSLRSCVQSGHAAMPLLDMDLSCLLLSLPPRRVPSERCRWCLWARSEEHPKALSNCTIARVVGSVGGAGERFDRVVQGTPRVLL
jgi:hypothetical protein